MAWQQLMCMFQTEKSEEGRKMSSTAQLTPHDRLGDMCVLALKGNLSLSWVP